LEGFIPEDAVDRVRSGTDIVELISEYVALKRTGANYLGLCPFHSEKTPSFTVSPSKQIFHCFGCGAGGDALGFLMRRENYTFPEAIKRLADRAGIPLPEPKTGRPQDKGETEALLRVNEEALAFFVDGLWKSKEGEKARRYLAGRGMTEELSHEFSLGYSLPAWDGLLKRLEKNGLPALTAEKAGLLLKKSSGQGFYDRFRDRVMFPIRDPRGRVIGFGGRSMGDEMPKYLNSPETPLFRKGETLYLMDVAAEHVRKRGYAVVVEGYFDAIACHRAGVKNAVATLGTALTPMHLRLLGRSCKKVMLVFDSDAAGQKAAERSLDVFLGTEMVAKVAMLPEGDDPDSLVVRDGPEGLAERLRSSEGLMDFVIKRKAAGAESIEDKVASAKALTGILARIKNSVERSHYVKKAASELGVEEAALVEELNKELRKTAVFKAPDRQAFSPPNRIEESLLHVMLHYPEVADEVRAALSADDFSDTRLRPVAAKIFGLLDGDGPLSVHVLLAALGDEADKATVRSLTLKDVGDNIDGFAKGAIRHIAEAKKARRRAEVQARMKQAEENKDPELLNKLQKEYKELM